MNYRLVYCVQRKMRGKFLGDGGNAELGSLVLASGQGCVQGEHGGGDGRNGAALQVSGHFDYL